MVVAHGNKRQKLMFYPHNGVVADPSYAKIEMDKNRTLEVSFPWLFRNSNVSLDSASKKVNRTSGSDVRVSVRLVL